MQKKNQNIGGFRSRKLLFALFALLLVFLGALLASDDDKIAGVYSVMVGGIEVITAIYLTGNVSSKWVVGKQPKQEDKEDKQD